MRVAWVVLVVLAAGCKQAAEQDAKQTAVTLTGGDVERGKAALQHYGCGGCHVIPGVPGATGQVGPSLEGIALRTYLAGRLPNAPENMVRWVQHPQAVEPGNAMPELGVKDGDARDIAAYLYTLR
ncbi:c-type cytochrome [Corallococcus exercitus]|uniref:c-type cytochrome n=1 Tax=Corallococcus exercitus TaxID=2316736 RepID=UPI0035D4096A